MPCVSQAPEIHHPGKIIYFKFLITFPGTVTVGFKPQLSIGSGTWSEFGTVYEITNDMLMILTND
jgi:hypothetical protein